MFLFVNFRYFSQKAARKKTDDDNMSDTESVSDGEFDAYLGKLKIIFWRNCFYSTYLKHPSVI